MDVSIVIVNWNVDELLEKCVESIKTKTRNVDYEIIVLDNASTVGHVEKIKDRHPDVILVMSDVNLGFAKGNNRAANIAKGKYILYLNPDTELVTNAIFGMYEFMERNLACGAIGCKLISQEGLIQYTCASTFPTLRTEFNELFCLYKIFPKSKALSTREMTYWNHENSRNVDCLSGACIMISAGLNSKLNGFDENLFMYSEDLDLCFRIRESGYKIQYLANERIIHHEGMSTRKMKQDNFETIKTRDANYYFVKKNYGWLQGQILRLVVLAGSIFRVGLIACMWLVSQLGLTNDKINLHDAFRKYSTQIAWSVGWTAMTKHDKAN